TEKQAVATDEKNGINEVKKEVKPEENKTEEISNISEQPKEIKDVNGNKIEIGRPLWLINSLRTEVEAVGMVVDIDTDKEIVTTKTRVKEYNNELKVPWSIKDYLLYTSESEALAALTEIKSTKKPMETTVQVSPIEPQPIIFKDELVEKAENEEKKFEEAAISVKNSEGEQGTEVETPDEIDLGQIAEADQALQKSLTEQSENLSANEKSQDIENIDWRDIDELIEEIDEGNGPRNYEAKFLNEILNQEELPEKLKEKIDKTGLAEKFANTGSVIEQYKARFLKGTLSFLSEKINYQWTQKTNDLLKEWSNDYAAREQREIEFQKKQDKTKWQKALGAMKILSNLGKVCGLGFSAMYKLAMYGTMAATEATGVAKRLRLDKEEVKYLDEKTAEEEAWALYEKAGIGKKMDSIAALDPGDPNDVIILKSLATIADKKIAIQQDEKLFDAEKKQQLEELEETRQKMLMERKPEYYAEFESQPEQIEEMTITSEKEAEFKADGEKLKAAYRQGLPEIILKRFENNKDQDFGALNNIAQDMMRKTVMWRLRWVNDKIASLEQNKSIDSEKRQSKINNLLWWNEKFLQDMDNMVGKLGTIDLISYGLKTAETAGKTASVLFIANTLKRSLINIIHHPITINIWHYLTEKDNSGLNTVTPELNFTSVKEKISATQPTFSPAETAPATPTATPEQSPTPAQTPIETLSPSPTLQQSPSPTSSPVEQPSLTPTEFKVQSPSPTNIPEPSPTPTEKIASYPARTAVAQPHNLTADGYLDLAYQKSDLTAKVDSLKKAAGLYIENKKFGEADEIIKNIRDIIEDKKGGFDPALVEPTESALAELEDKILQTETVPVSDWSIYETENNFSDISGKRGLYGGAEEFVKKVYGADLNKFAPGSNEYKAALALRADRVKDLLVQDIKNNNGEYFGLKGVTNPDKISAKQFAEIKWDEVQKAVEDDKFFSKNLEPEEVKNITDYGKPKVDIINEAPVKAKIELPVAEITSASVGLPAEEFANAEIKSIDIHNLFPAEASYAAAKEQMQLIAVDTNKDGQIDNFVAQYIDKQGARHKLFTPGQTEEAAAKAEVSARVADLFEAVKGTDVKDPIDFSLKANIPIWEADSTLKPIAQAGITEPTEARQVMEFSAKQKLPLEDVARHHFWLGQEKQGLTKTQIADIIKLTADQKNEQALNELITGNKDEFPYEDYETINVVAPGNVHGKFENITLRYHAVGAEHKNYDVTLFASEGKGRIVLDGQKVSEFKLEQAKNVLRDPAEFIKNKK
ncbi:MAG: hypothetical protein WCV41_03325, partial [Patescibacteria group bacterium]